MGGFGVGPFGSEPFGQWNWARQVFFDTLPGLYREQDAASGGLLELWTESLHLPFNQTLDQIRRFTDLRSPLKVRTQYTETETVRLGAVKIPQGEIEQRGVDGAINFLRQFSSISARFKPSDQNNQLVLTGSGVAINNRTFVIAAVVNTTTVVCDPPLVVDSGPIRWQVVTVPEQVPNTVEVELRGGDASVLGSGWLLYDGFAQFEIIGRQQFFPSSAQNRNLTEKEGVAGNVLLDGRFAAETPFAQTDVGKKVTVTGSPYPPNNGKYEIYAVDPAAPEKVSFTQPITIVGTGGGVEYALIPGNTDVSVTQVQTGNNIPLSIFVANNLITVTLATDAFGSVTSTNADVATALTSDPLASNLVTASLVAGGTAGVQAATVIPGSALRFDDGPLTWALLPFPHVLLAGAGFPSGVVQQEGVDLVVGVASPTTVKARSARFAATDVGKRLVIRGSQLGNNGPQTITSVDNGTQAQCAAASFAAEANLTWEVRSLSGFGDGTQALVSAPSLIQWLAQDFAIPIDTRESDARQRGWVENVTQWIDLKGTAKAYGIIGSISGYNVTALGLWRIGLNMAPLLSGQVYEVGENTLGRAGGDGRLISSSGRTGFEAPTALFTASDVGTQILIENSTTSGNNVLYTIATVVSPSHVEFPVGDSAVLPDYGPSGSPTGSTLVWRLTRLYTSAPPLLPRFDEIDVETLQEIVGLPHFQVDKFCWESDFVSSFQVILGSVDPPTTGGVPVAMTVTAEGGSLPGPIYTSMGVVRGVGNWKITDASGYVFYVESIPRVLPSAFGPSPPVSSARGYPRRRSSYGRWTVGLRSGVPCRLPRPWCWELPE